VKVAGAAPPGEVVRVAIPPDRAHVFDATTGLRLGAATLAAAA
jgi:hypothetical protein